MTRWTPEQWDQEGRSALLDLIAEKVAVPWVEAVARISRSSRTDLYPSTTGWKNYRVVQPLQLEAARRGLLAEGAIFREQTEHVQPIVTYSLRDPGLTEDAVTRIRGHRRSLYRTYVKWTGDPPACGHHAEKVLFASLQAAAGIGQFVIPNQRVGHVPTVLGSHVTKGPLDALALLPDLERWGAPVAMVIEVKNVHEWIYAWDRRLWELLVKAAGLALEHLVFPVLACAHSDITAQRMGIDLGFSRAPYGIQLFTTDTYRVPDDAFSSIAEEFGLLALRHPADEPFTPLVDFFANQPRREARSLIGLPDRRPWCVVAAERFRAVAPVILRFDALAGDIEQPERGNVHRAFETAARDVATWPWKGGWGHGRGSF
jgi:hypothetical protein